ncbi:MAG: metallophosphoesterase [Phycisphaeraceae bacterium]|nr:MAG: metallophosphoesterase [Phycisphaeraceae bacterium]
MSEPMHRRQVLKAAAAGAVALGLSPRSRAEAVPPLRASGAKRALRVAHLTDIHVQPELRAAEGLAAALAHVQSLDDKPQLILTGGDHVMDCFSQDEARTKLQWELLAKVFRDGNSLPVRHAIGNHDVWGWNKGKSKTTGDEPMWGKRFALDQIGMERSYHSFDQAGWHFVCLDSISHDPNNANGYLGKLGDEQIDWLARDLESTPKSTPVLVLSHIPILTVTGILGRPDKKSNDYNCSGGVMHTDSSQIRDLFARHPNVKVCLSGHTHRLDRVDFCGVSYICNGAVCGNWWKGVHYECREGFAVLDLFSDGSFENTYIPYGWHAESQG